MSYLLSASLVFTISVGSIPAHERIEVKIVVSELKAGHKCYNYSSSNTVCDDPAE